MAGELTACPQCTRNNNPLRTTCIYCGAALPVAEEISAQMLASRAAFAHEKPSERELDPLSQISQQLQQNLSGFTIVLLPGSIESPDKAAQAVIAATRFNDLEARQALGASRAMPLARFQYELEAKALQERLQSEGLKTLLVSDEQLQPASPNRRVKHLSVQEDSLTIRFEGKLEDANSIAAKDIRLIVEGKIRHRQYQTTEQNKGFGKTERELTDAIESIDEHPVLDVYADSVGASFRIRGESFDYSGLGGKMKLTAIENFRMLSSALRELAPSAVFDDDFKNQMKLLELVWPSTSRSESMGLKRAQLLTAGKISTRAVQRFDNELQFNRYSRLRFHMLNQGENKAES